MEITIIKEYGVVHLSGAFTLGEQEELFNAVKGHVRGVGDAPGIFHASSGQQGSAHRVESLHNLGELLFSRCAEALVESIEGGGITADEIQNEPALRRLSDAVSGKNPPNVNNVTGASYKRGAKMNNHSDLNRPLYTMSVAVGDTCDFTVGKPTARPYKNERSGKPVTISMQSGDSIYFDGGSVPHEVARLEPDTGPLFFKKGAPRDIARISILFREPC
ncbi:hypothetical protein TrCOL_g11619 [Triparma columacea]|uniref:Alpha-ketoglutarate-dependent dioxygenase AlkB-like domain-containing protein n=1 Tax=Triparma columacea TaxID=722753 RepID=A0A9W7GQ04_9STRA|nr:hypothetical protein TrCOL_g11619 [Triparma columacea]